MYVERREECKGWRKRGGEWRDRGGERGREGERWRVVYVER